LHMSWNAYRCLVVSTWGSINEWLSLSTPISLLSTPISLLNIVCMPTMLCTGLFVTYYRKGICWPQWWSYITCCINTVNGGISLERYFGTACTVLAWWVVHCPCQVFCQLRDMHWNWCPQEGQGSSSTGFPE
jgi:hypothetical protein